MVFFVKKQLQNGYILSAAAGRIRNPPAGLYFPVLSLYDIVILPIPGTQENFNLFKEKINLFLPFLW